MGAYLRHFQVKIVLLGGERSGKSSLLYRYIYHDFRDTPPSTFDTAFAAKKVEVDGQPCALALWDTAGSRQFSHLSKLFCRGADAVLVCFDITSRQNWERVKVWVHEARMRQPGCQVYLVATKMDLVQPQPEGTESSESGASLGSASASPSSSDLQQPGVQQGLGAAGSPDNASAPAGTALAPASQPAAEPVAEQEAAACDGGSSSSACCGGGGSSRDSSGLQLPRQSFAPAATPATAASRVTAAVGGTAALSVRPGPSSGGFCEQPGSSLAGSAWAGGVPAAACEDEWEAATRNSSRRQLHFEEPLPQHREQQQQGEGAGGVGTMMRAKVPAVPDPEIDLFASSVGAHVFRTSARTGEGVSDLFQAVAQECCHFRRQHSSGYTSPAKQQQQQPRGPAQHWGWWGQQGAADVKSGPPTPTTPLQGSAAPAPSSFSAARYSMDSCGEGSSGDSGRRPGITHSKEWQRQLCGGSSSHQLQQQQQAQAQLQARQEGPGEYVLGSSAFQAPVQRSLEGCYFQGAGYDDELPPSMPEIDYTARGSCVVM